MCFAFLFTGAFIFLRSSALPLYSVHNTAIDENTLVVLRPSVCLQVPCTKKHGKLCPICVSLVIPATPPSILQTLPNDHWREPSCASPARKVTMEGLYGRSILPTPMSRCTSNMPPPLVLAHHNTMRYCGTDPTTLVDAGLLCVN